MKLIYFFILAFISFYNTSAAQLPNNNMYLLRNINQHPVPVQYGAPWNYAAVWGYVAPNGREYAILGCVLGTAFYDVTDSANIREIDFFPEDINFTSPDQGNLWREVKVYSHYAYVVSEADTSGVKIFNLQYLPDTVIYVKKFTATGHRSTHSISQEGSYLYLNGSNASFGNGISVLDLSADPLNPVLRGKWNTRYVHDSRILRDTIFAMNINSGDGQITVIDARNKDSLKTITQWLNLPNPSPHNCALSKDRKFLFATDEVGAIPRLLKIWNIQDLASTSLVTTWQPSNITTSIIHNVETYGDTAVIAHYTAGVRVLNVSNPSAPVEIGWYDTYPQNNNNIYQGCWGVYKLPSGKIIASDMNTGLYVLKTGNSVGINEHSSEAVSFKLLQNFPNPFNPSTKISFDLIKRGHVSLKINDISGKESVILLNKTLNEGSYSVEWDASEFQSGVYFYTIESEGYRQSKKMLLIK